MYISVLDFCCTSKLLLTSILLYIKWYLGCFSALRHFKFTVTDRIQEIDNCIYKSEHEQLNCPQSSYNFLLSFGTGLP